jgi:periplasmic protein TonB
MSTTTVNTFPPLHALDSPKGWFLALIVLLHLGFVWALNNGLSFSKLIFKPKDIIVVVPDEPTPPPPPDTTIIDHDPIDWSLTVVEPIEPTVQIQEEDEQLAARPTESQDYTPVTVARPLVKPTIVEPAIPRSGLSEPLYPASEIRAEHFGTVLLSVEVLENGRVGEVRLLQSSGFAKLDESAMREARKWRFVPGTRDGVPVVRWRQVPITFELQERR